MSTVVPKLLYSESQGCDIPVWEISTRYGKSFLFERTEKEGYRPIGRIPVGYGDSILWLCDTVNTLGNDPVVLKEKDGYKAPMSWYESISSESSQTDFFEQARETWEAIKAELAY